MPPHNHPFIRLLQQFSHCLSYVSSRYWKTFPHPALCGKCTQFSFSMSSMQECMNTITNKDTQQWKSQTFPLDLHTVCMSHFFPLHTHESLQLQVTSKDLERWGCDPHHVPPDDKILPLEQTLLPIVRPHLCKSQQRQMEENEQGNKESPTHREKKMTTNQEKTSQAGIYSKYF